MLNNTSEFGVGDHEISTISSVQRKKLYLEAPHKKKRYDSALWHSDIQFEPYPADYTSLRLTQLPSSGGDTLWASGYDIYDRFSPAYQKFFDGLTATFIGEGFIKAANEGRTTLYTEQRGSPENVGGELTAVHPVVRTNPVTGWKSIFSLGTFPKLINELSDDEGAELIKKFTDVILENHDIQVRFKWRNKNDIGESPSGVLLGCMLHDYTNMSLKPSGITGVSFTQLHTTTTDLARDSVTVWLELERNHTLIPIASRKLRHSLSSSECDS